MMASAPSSASDYPSFHGSHFEQTQKQGEEALTMAEPYVQVTSTNWTPMKMASAAFGRYGAGTPGGRGLVSAPAAVVWMRMRVRVCTVASDDCNGYAPEQVAKARRCTEAESV